MHTSTNWCLPGAFFWSQLREISSSKWFRLWASAYSLQPFQAFFRPNLILQTCTGYNKDLHLFCLCLHSLSKRNLTCGWDSFAWNPALRRFASRIGIFFQIWGRKLYPNTALHSVSSLRGPNTKISPAFVLCCPESNSYKFLICNTDTCRVTDKLGTQHMLI